MMNRLQVLIIILIAFVGCDNPVTNTSSTIESVNQSENEAKNKNSLEAGEPFQDSTIYHSGAASWQVIRSKPDTLIYENYKVVAYTHFNKFKTDVKSKRKTRTIFIDSVEVVEPINATIVSPLKQNAFDVDTVESYDIGKFVRIRDINNDGKFDIDMYNLQISKYNNILYDVFLRTNGTFKYSEELSIRNLEYDSTTNTYSSIFYSDKAGRGYVLNRYRYETDSLKLIEVEHQTFEAQKKKYLRKNKNFITGEITIKEIEHER
jgi:hypothetical protein